MLFKIRHSIFLPYFFKVYRRMKDFEKKVHAAVHATTLDQRLSLAQSVTWMGVNQATGYYASPELEKIYIEVAATLPRVICAPIKDTVLHIMTRAYMSGGHTRVVHRWIDLSMPNEKHDIIVLEQGAEPFPSWLNDAAVKHHGEVVRFNEPNLVKRAEKLRTLAAKYERIILHVHMDDPTALIAFGDESFTTPIVFFNHADHLFWLGVSISDMVAELRTDHISYSRRNVNQSYPLGIPCAKLQQNDIQDKQSLRAQLNIPENEFVIITTGEPFKYQGLGSNGIQKVFNEIVKRESNVSCYAIGPDASSDQWKRAVDESKGKICPLGVVKNKELYQSYLQAADLYICSYPFLGYTAMLDAVQCGLPYIQMLTNRMQNKILVYNPDFDQSRCICHTTKEIVNKIINVMHSKEEYGELLAASKRWAEDYANQEQWQKRLYDMYAQCPKQHHIHSFEIQRGKQVFIDDDVCLNGLLYEREKFNIKNPIMRCLANAWLRLKGL